MAETTSNHFCWKELATPDDAGCERFYRQVFGWTSQQQSFEKTTYTVFQAGGQNIGGMLQMTAEWGQMPAHWMAYIAVDDVDATARKVQENGGKVCIPPTDISVGRFAVLNDPSGAVFSIIKMKA
jgi:predicted enzyme related to lactoylglutathione lyase